VAEAWAAAAALAAEANGTARWVDGRSGRVPGRPTTTAARIKPESAAED